MQRRNDRKERRDADAYDALWRPYSLAEELSMRAALCGDRPALADRRGRMTYGELYRAAEAIAAGLRDRGLRPGDRAILQFPNCIEFVLAVYACLRLGVIPVLTLPAYREADIDLFCEAVTPAAYFAPRSFAGYAYAPLVEKMRARHASLRLFVSDTDGVPDSVPLASLNGDASGMPFPDAAGTAFVLMTGGTTSAPKMIPKTHRQYYAYARASAQRCGVTEDSVYMATLPAGHHFSMGSPGIVGAFSQGAKVVLTPTPTFDEVFPLVEKEKVTVMPAVPPLLRAWTEARSWDSSDLSSLERIQVGGGPVDAATLREAREALQCAIQQAYGFTEGLVCYTDPDEELYEGDMQIQGRALFDEDELRIVDEAGRDVAPGVTGELIVRGPCILSSYFAARETLDPQWLTPDGFYRSGDLAAWTESGRLLILGRLKDIINRGGEKYAATEIENRLRSCPGVADAAVVGVPDRMFGERQCAWLIPEEGTAPPTLAAVHAFLRGQGVAPFKLPDQLEYAERWPLTAAGKINKRQLTLMAEERSA